MDCKAHLVRCYMVDIGDKFGEFIDDLATNFVVKYSFENFEKW